MYTVLTDLQRQIVIPENGILSRTLHNEGGVKVIGFGFSKGQELSAHSAPMPATIQILEGQARVTLGEEEHQLGPGAFAYMAPNLRHAIVAETPLRLLLTMFSGARQ